MEGMHFSIRVGSQREAIAKAESRQIGRNFLSRVLEESGRKDGRSVETKGGECQRRNASSRPQYVQDISVYGYHTPISGRETDYSIKVTTGKASGERERGILIPHLALKSPMESRDLNIT